MLLKNANSRLPLSVGKNIAVVGPHANASRFLLQVVSTATVWSPRLSDARPFRCCQQWIDEDEFVAFLGTDSAEPRSSRSRAAAAQSCSSFGAGAEAAARHHLELLSERQDHEQDLDIAAEEIVPIIETKEIQHPRPKKHGQFVTNPRV